MLEIRSELRDDKVVPVLYDDDEEVMVIPKKIVRGEELMDIPEKYMRMPESKLCIDYMTYPSYNIHQENRSIAISRRNIDCRPYIGMAQRRQQSNQDFERLLNNLKNIQ